MNPSSETESDEEPNPPLVSVGAGVHSRGGIVREASPDDGVLLISRQRVLRGDWEKLRRFLGQLHSAVSRQPFSVCLISDRAMRRYNKQYRHQDTTTDVLSFPAENDSHAPGSYLGDILISVETARENAVCFGVKLEAEIKLLALHGVLHLMGYDHETDRGQMARAERRWCGRLGLPAPLTMRSGKPRQVASTGNGTGSMHLLIAFLIAAGSLLLTLFSYVNRLYTEKGRFLIRGSKDNVDFFEEQVEPKLKIGEEEAEGTFPFLIQLSLILLVVLVIAWNIGQPLEGSTLFQGAVFMIFDALLFAEVIPHALLARTSGAWLLPAAPLLRASILLVYPLVGIGRFLHHFASGGNEETEVEEPTPSQNIETLIMAGEEEGLIEQADRRLIRSVVEFGDKTVREVMTPRPEIFAVPAETTLAQLKQMLATRRHSRIPVYQGDLDHILGFVHAHDILPLAEKDSAGTTVRKLLRPIIFVPETKSVSELLKEIQQKAQIAIVVDEYGSVAGLVTVEDMVEEIVGEIGDEHEAHDVLPQGAGAYNVPGSMDLDRLYELFGVRIGDAGEATTVSGLLTGTMGRVPIPGEILERDGLVFKVIESNGRKIVRLLISKQKPNPAVAERTSPPAPDEKVKAS